MKQTYDNQYDSCRNFASQKMLRISKKKKVKNSGYREDQSYSNNVFNYFPNMIKRA